MSVEKDMIKVSVVVDEILSVSDDAKNSDKILIWYYFKAMGIDISKEDILRMPSFESITRSRRKFQAEGKYLSNDQVAKERSDKEQEYERWSLNK